LSSFITAILAWYMYMQYMINRIMHAKINIAWHISSRGLRPSGWYGIFRADMPCNMDFSMYYSLCITKIVSISSSYLQLTYCNTWELTIHLYCLSKYPGMGLTNDHELRIGLTKTHFDIQ
jgi:hypothetical protein